MSRLSLPGRAYALNNLLVLLQVPPMREKYQDVPAVLKVEPMAGAGRMRENKHF